MDLDSNIKPERGGQPHAFAQLGLPAFLIKAVAELGYDAPTPIQEKGIPAVLTKKDLIASAQTGTGKTAAFSLPLLSMLGRHRRGGSPRVLILEPTRELAAQVVDELAKFGKYSDLRVALLHGGVGYGNQRNALLYGSDIVVATPGRLLDFIAEKTLKLDDLEVLVLDEVDRMLDMGFIRDVKRIVSACPEQRQTLFFSATIPPEIEEIARFALKSPQKVSVAPARSVNTSVTHAIYPVAHVQKFELLAALLAHSDLKSTIVFCRTKHGSDKVARKLRNAGHKVGVLHANRSQNQRKEALASFKDGRTSILVATDIAARGIDVAGVTHVINYDIPSTPADYVHRIGRTGRAAAEGDAFTLCTPEDLPDVRAIEKLIKQPIPRQELADFDYLPLGTPTPPKPVQGRHPHQRPGPGRSSPGRPGRRAPR